MASTGGSGLIVVIVSTATAVSPAATGLLLADQDGCKLDSLKPELLTRAAEEIHRALGRLIRGPELDADRLAEEVGKIFLHLTVQNEGDVGIQLLLKLVELLLAEFPRAGLEHGQHEDILPGVVGESIQHAGALDSGTGRRPVVGRQIFAEGNHT